MPEPLPVKEAQARILACFSPNSLEEVTLREACGRVLGQAIQATLDLPPFDNSGMDGFALRSTDTTPASSEHPVLLTVVMDIAAGTSPQKGVGTGEAARIMTGAPLPPGADAIIPIEETNARSLSSQDKVTIYHPVREGDFVRQRGQDVRYGDSVLHPGRKLQPQDIGLLASLGINQVQVHRKPRVALLSSGDELVKPDQDLAPGQIHDSNSYMISALVKNFGGEIVSSGFVKDDPGEIRQSLDQAVLAGVDMILTTAGVSVGAFDYMRAILTEQGKLDFWKVNMRPGKPLAFGTYNDIPLIGLPGNPVSCFVGFLVFVQPVIQLLTGQKNGQRPTIKAQLAEPVESDGRESYLRASLVRVNGKIFAHLPTHQGSGNIFSLVRANALLIVPSGVKSLAIGSEVEAWLLDNELEFSTPDLQDSN